MSLAAPSPVEFHDAFQQSIEMKPRLLFGQPIPEMQERIIAAFTETQHTEVMQEISWQERAIQHLQGMPEVSFIFDTLAPARYHRMRLIRTEKGALRHEPNEISDATASIITMQQRRASYEAHQHKKDMSVIQEFVQDGRKQIDPDGKVQADLIANLEPKLVDVQTAIQERNQPAIRNPNDRIDRYERDVERVYDGMRSGKISYREVLHVAQAIARKENTLFCNPEKARELYLANGKDPRITEILYRMAPELIKDDPTKPPHVSVAKILCIAGNTDNKVYNRIATEKGIHNRFATVASFDIAYAIQANRRYESLMEKYNGNLTEVYREYMQYENAMKMIRDTLYSPFQQVVIDQTYLLFVDAKSQKPTSRFDVLKAMGRNIWVFAQAQFHKEVAHTLRISENTKKRLVQTYDVDSFEAVPGSKVCYRDAKEGLIFGIVRQVKERPFPKRQSNQPESYKIMTLTRLNEEGKELGEVTIKKSSLNQVDDSFILATDEFIEFAYMNEQLHYLLNVPLLSINEEERMESISAMIAALPLKVQQENGDYLEKIKKLRVLEAVHEKKVLHTPSLRIDPEWQRPELDVDSFAGSLGDPLCFIDKENHFTIATVIGEGKSTLGKYVEVSYRDKDGLMKQQKLTRTSFHPQKKGELEISDRYVKIAQLNFQLKEIIRMPLAGKKANEKSYELQSAINKLPIQFRTQYWDYINQVLALRSA